tara:strand:+ start:838 stop:1149 length:312 start_codon:yes stop_codon:yes gene_type:complete
MPFDGNPKQFVKPDVFSLEGLAAWLETQDGETKYDFCDAGSCLITAWHVAHGHHKITASQYSSGIYLWSEQEPDTVWSDIAQGYPRTYAAALDRCRALIAEGK